MTKTRTISDMLQIIHDNIVNTLQCRTMLYSGICLYARELFGRHYDNYLKLDTYLGDNLPPPRYGYLNNINVINHSWKPFRPYYRLKWLKKHIELTKTH